MDKLYRLRTIKVLKESRGLGAELSVVIGDIKGKQSDSELKPPKLLLLLVTKVSPSGSVRDSIFLFTVSQIL